MNGEEQFEQWLRRQPQRQIPSSWRDEILTAAKATGSAGAPAGVGSFPVVGQKCNSPAGAPALPVRIRLAVVSQWLRNLLWPAPQAWAALGAAWVLVLALNLSSREPSRPGIVGQTVQATPEVRELLREQEQLIAELMWRPAPAEARKPALHQPRSQRRQETSMA